jgi:Holliday junction resolvase RusA-like endonuclease
MIYKFSIPGKPQGKQRPRSTKSGRIYTPKETVSYEATVRDYALYAGVKPIDGPVALTIRAIFETPPSWSMKKRAAHIGQPHTSKPDADNIVKTVKDGLNRVAYADDAQVASVSCSKEWGPKAGINISIQPRPVDGWRSIGQIAADMIRGEIE